MFLKYFLDVYKSQELKPETKVDDKKEEEYFLTSLPGICQPPSKTEVTKRKINSSMKPKLTSRRLGKFITLSTRTVQYSVQHIS